MRLYLNKSCRSIRHISYDFNLVQHAVPIHLYLVYIRVTTLASTMPLGNALDSSDRPALVQNDTIIQQRSSFVEEFPACCLECILKDHEKSCVRVKSCSVL